MSFLKLSIFLKLWRFRGLCLPLSVSTLDIPTPITISYMYSLIGSPAECHQ